MAVTWERFSGSTDKFAIRISFMPDPHHGAAADPEESASWGALQVWVKDQNLCAHIDQGETLHSAHWYLLPFLEWVVDSWNPLLHEERLPNRNLSETAVKSLEMTRLSPALATDAEAAAWEREWFEWRQRHSLRVARDGGLLPNIVFRRLRDEIELSWNDEPLAGTPSGFLFSSSGGSASIPPQDVAEPLFDVVSLAIAHLAESNPSSARVQKLQAALKTLSSAPENDARLSWLAGLDTTSRAPQGSLAAYTRQVRAGWQKIRSVLENLDLNAARAALAVEGSSPLVIQGSCQAALLFGSVSPNISEEDVRTLAQVLITQYDRQGTNHSRLLDYSEEEPLDFSSPAWEQGYYLAETLHDQYDLPGSFIDVRKFVGNLGVEITRLRLEDSAIRACSLIGPQHKPTIALNDSYPNGTKPSTERFSLAHELCHILYDRSHGQRVALASGPWAPVGIEKRANAFAAMFLMPPHLLRQVISASNYPVSDKRGVQFVCDQLQVGFTAAVEHLYNLTFMSVAEHDALLGYSNDY